MFAAKRLVNRAATSWRLRALSSAEMAQDPVKVITYPGSRVLEFTRPESGNVLTESVLNTVKTKLQLYSELPNVNVVLFTSSSTEFFSSGLETRFLDEKERRKQLVQAATEASTLIAQADKETIAVVSGDVDASVFGVLATAKYRLGTETTKFSVRDLLDGRLPIGGGITHHLISTGEHGLAVSAQEMSCNTTPFTPSHCSHIARAVPGGQRTRPDGTRPIHARSGNSYSAAGQSGRHTGHRSGSYSL